MQQNLEKRCLRIMETKIDDNTSFQLFHKDGLEILLEERDLRTLLDKHFPYRSLLLDKVDKIVWKANAEVIAYHPL